MDNASLYSNPKRDLESFRKYALSHNAKGDMGPRIEASGDFQELTSTESILEGLVTILLTSSNTYLFDPEFGVGLYKYIFEPADEITRNSIENEVMDAIRKYENRAKIGFTVHFLSNKKGFRIDLTITNPGKQKIERRLVIDESLLKTLPDDTY
jgi:phage baseplate assembly protein W